MKYASRTLGSGNIKQAVQLPEGEDLNEWIAVNSEYRHFQHTHTHIHTCMVVYQFKIILLSIDSNNSNSLDYLTSISLLELSWLCISQ